MTPGAAAGGYSGYALMMFLGRAFGDGVVHRLGRTRVVALGALAVFAGIGLAVGLASPAVDNSGLTPSRCATSGRRTSPTTSSSSGAGSRRTGKTTRTPRQPVSSPVPECDPYVGG